MARLTEISSSQLSPEQRKVHDAIASGPRGRVEGPLKVWLTSHELAEKAQQLGAFCRYGTSLPLRLSELAILVTGAYWKAGFEWHVHAPIGLKAGLDPDALEKIRKGEGVTFSKPDEAAVYDFSHELLHQRRVTNETYVRARLQIGERGCVELVGILGYYALISMTIVAFEVPVPPGSVEPFSGRP